MPKKILITYFSLLLIVFSGLFIFKTVKLDGLSQSSRLARNAELKSKLTNLQTAQENLEEPVAFEPGSAGDSAVLASTEEIPPEIGIRKIESLREQFYYGGMQGLINFSDLENPQIEINIKNVTGKLTVDLYNAGTNNLLTFLIHDKEFN